MNNQETVEYNKVKQELLQEKAKSKALRTAIEVASAETNSRNAMIARLKAKYFFFRSNHPSSSFILSSGDTIVFQAESRVTGRDVATNRVNSEDSWGQYFTTNKQVASEIRAACSSNPGLSEMTQEEANDVIESIQASHSFN